MFFQIWRWKEKGVPLGLPRRRNFFRQRRESGQESRRLLRRIMPGTPEIACVEAMGGTFSGACSPEKNARAFGRDPGGMAFPFAAIKDDRF